MRMGLCIVREEFLILLPIGHSLGHVTTHVVVGPLVQLVCVANVDVGGGGRGPLVQQLLVDSLLEPIFIGACHVQRHDP